MRYWKSRQRLMAVALVLACIATLALGSASGLATVEQDVLVNGSFEGGFVSQPGCGMVGKGWGCFTNGGSITYGFYDDQWVKVVADGAHSQLIELNTMQFAASEPDRYAGIYQTVNVVPGATYTLKLQGLMRERDPNSGEDAYRYRVQWGYTADGATDWQAVTNWQELPWDRIDNRTSPGSLQSFKGALVAPSGKITLFIRVWKKWGTVYKELDVNLDAISLVGPATKNVVVITPGVKNPPVVVVPGDKNPPVVVVRPGGPEPLPVVPPLACGGANLIANGNFESGFTNGVGSNWTSFTNGGAAAYGFYDEMWPPVVKSPAHGQLIEINTWGLAAADPDRKAGIYQVVRGLKPGATYEISLWGMLREDAVHSGDDAFRYRVLWGYAAADADPTNADIANWVELPWDTIYTRTAPGAMSSFSARFQAPSDSVVIAFSALKKWGTVQRELDVNLDSISLTECGSIGPVQCTHVVARGETLGIIAKKYNTTVEVLVRLNGLKNANVLLVGQTLKVPCIGQPPDGGGNKPPDGGACVWYVVVRGDSVSKIAAQHGTTVAAIVAANHLKNANLIFVGQKLCVPDP
jgi:nucleoid-associated protein YgaU